VRAVVSFSACRKSRRTQAQSRRDGSGGRPRFNLGCDLDWVPFEWSGENSFAGRGAAAKKLILWHERESGAEHVVIAHSHGGSVSLMAARELDLRGPHFLSKLICLATPFATLHPSPRDARELAARYISLRFGWIPLLLIVLLFVADPYTTPYPRDSIYRLIRTFGLYSDILVLVIAPLFFLLRKTRFVKFEPPVQWHSITVPQGWLLYAERAPGDEASIVINASQFIEWISDLLFARLIFRPHDRLVSRLKSRIKQIRLALWGTFALLLLLSALISSFGGDVGIAFFLFFLVLGSLGTLAFCLAALTGPIILIPANWLLALAVGTDVLRYHGVMQIECEPVPSGITGIVSTVALSDDEQIGLGLVHFIHASNSARAPHRSCVRQVQQIWSWGSGEAIPSEPPVARSQILASDGAAERGGSIPLVGP
jgi:hypothetical protein